MKRRGRNRVYEEEVEVINREHIREGEKNKRVATTSEGNKQNGHQKRKI